MNYHMEIKNTVLLLIIVAAFCCITPVYAQTAVFTSITSPETATPGEVVTVEIIIEYDFDEQTLVSPGIYHLVEEVYLAEAGIEVSGTGTETVSLSFNAPDVEGEYVFICDMYYQNGTNWMYAGQDDYYITLTVGSGSTLTGWSAVIDDVEYPSVVTPGGSMEITVTVEYDFPKSTNMEVGVSDPGTGEALNVVTEVKDGSGTEEYKIIVSAPNEVGTHVLGADVVYETDYGWDFTEGGVMTFTFEVDDNASGGGIPGFPWVSTLMGTLLVIGLLQYSGRKTPLI